MFQLNKEIKTKDGKVVKPFLVEGTTVYCFNRSGKTVIKSLEDFDFTPVPDKKRKMVIVTPVIVQNDQLFEEEPEKNEAIENLEISEKIEAEKLLVPDAKDINEKISYNEKFNNDEYI